MSNKLQLFDFEGFEERQDFTSVSVDTEVQNNGTVNQG